MKTKLLTTTLFAFFGLNINAQTTFQKTYGDTVGNAGFSIQQTADAGYIIAGYTKGFSLSDAYLIKTNNNGDTLWTQVFGGANDEEILSVRQTTDNGYILAGSTTSFGAGNEDVYLIKTNTNGDTLWTRTFGTPNSDYALNVQQTTDNGYIVAGVTSNFSSSWDFYMVKTNVNGDTLWTKKYGGVNADVNYSMQQTTDNGYILTGSTSSFGAGGDDVYLIKTNSTGDTLWTKTYGGSSNEIGYSVRQTTDGGYIVAGLTTSFGVGNEDVYLIKTNSLGDTLWTKTFGGANMDYANSIRQTSDGGFIITGYTESFGGGNGDAYLIKTDVNGSMLWTRTYGTTNTDESYDVHQTIDGGYAISGYIGGFGVGSIYLIKTDPNGNGGGCNEYVANTIVGTTTTQIMIPATQVASGGIVNTTNSVIGRGGIVTTLCTTVGMNEINNHTTISVYPNPFISFTTIQLNLTINNGELNIINVYGQQIKKIKNISGQTITLNRDNLSSGLYFIRVTQDNKVIATDKLIITD